MLEQSGKHAYLILAHADMPLLRCLVEMLDDERNDIYIHADKKWKDFSPAFLQTKYARLVCLTERKRVYWGHTSIMKVELQLMQIASEQGQYAYYHLLSGADLPIKTQDYIHNYFAQNQGREFITLWKEKSHIADARYKVERYHIGMRYERGLPRIPSILLAKLRFGISDVLLRLLGSRIGDEKIYKGSQWFSLTDRAVRYILSQKDYIKDRYRFTRACDEIFIPTILMSSPLMEHIIQSQSGQDILRYMDWPSRTPSPKVLKMLDKEALEQSSCLFARKFSSEIDADIISWVSKMFA